MILDDETVLAVYANRVRPGIVASISRDFGRTWDHDRDLVLYDSGTGTEPGVGENLDLSGQWSTMVRYRFGHPRAIHLPSGEAYAVWYGGDEGANEALWARLAME